MIQILLFNLLYSSFQSYALYIIGDENATSTDVSKYLVKLSAGMCIFSVFLWPALKIILLLDCVFLTEPFDCICVCVCMWTFIDIQPLLPASPVVPCFRAQWHEKRKASDAGLHVTWFPLFVFASTKTTQHSVEVTAVAAGIWSAVFPLTQNWTLTL